MPIVLVEFAVLINSNVIVFWVDTEYEPSAFEWGIQCCQISYDYKLLTDQIPCSQVQRSSENHLTLIFPKGSLVDVFQLVKWLLHEPQIQNAAVQIRKELQFYHNDQSEIKIKHWNSWKLDYQPTRHRPKQSLVLNIWFLNHPLYVKLLWSPAGLGNVGSSR